MPPSQGAYSRCFPCCSLEEVCGGAAVYFGSAAFASPWPGGSDTGCCGPCSPQPCPLVVHWEGRTHADATWEVVEDFKDRYPAFQLTDELFDGEWGSVVDSLVGCQYRC